MILTGAKTFGRCRRFDNITPVSPKGRISLASGHRASAIQRGHMCNRNHSDSVAEQTELALPGTVEFALEGLTMADLIEVTGYHVDLVKNVATSFP